MRAGVLYTACYTALINTGYTLQTQSQAMRNYKLLRKKNWTASRNQALDDDLKLTGVLG